MTFLAKFGKKVLEIKTKAVKHFLTTMSITTKTLRNLGFSDAEVKIYKSGLKIGPSSARLLANEAQISRTLAYHALDALMERGLVSKVGAKHGAKFQMESPEKIKNVLDRKQKELESMKKDIDLVTTELSSISEKSKDKPHIRFFQGIEGFKNVAQEVLETKEKKIRSLASIKGVMDTVDRAFMKQWFEEVEKRGIASQSIWSAKNVDPDFQHSRRDLRIAPKGMEFPNTILIYDNTVIVFSGGRTVFAFVIESEEFAKTMKEMFDQVWKNSRVPN